MAADHGQVEDLEGGWRGPLEDNKARDLDAICGTKVVGKELQWVGARGLNSKLGMKVVG